MADWIAEFSVKYLDLGTLPSGEHAYFASVLDLDGCLTEGHGRTREDALATARRMVKDAISSYLSAHQFTIVRIGNEDWQPQGLRFTRRQGDMSVICAEVTEGASKAHVQRRAEPVYDFAATSGGRLRGLSGFIERTRISIPGTGIPQERHTTRKTVQ